MGLLLLGDLRMIFEEAGKPTALFSEFILDRLNDREDRPWADWKAGKPLSAAQLANLLRPFGIQPRQVRIENDSKKGYGRAWFEEAFARYLLPLDPKQPKQAIEISDLRTASTRNTESLVSDEEPTETAENKGDASDVSGVSDPEGQSVDGGVAPRLVRGAV